LGQGAGGQLKPLDQLPRAGDLAGQAGRVALPHPAVARLPLALVVVVAAVAERAAGRPALRHLPAAVDTRAGAGLGRRDRVISHERSAYGVAPTTPWPRAARHGRSAVSGRRRQRRRHGSCRVTKTGAVMPVWAAHTRARRGRTGPRRIAANRPRPFAGGDFERGVPAAPTHRRRSARRRSGGAAPATAG